MRSVDIVREQWDSEPLCPERLGANNAHRHLFVAWLLSAAEF